MKHLIALAAIFIIIISCNEKNSSIVSSQNLPQKNYYISGPYSTDLTVRRKYHWKLVNKPPSESGCLGGKGLCISGDEIPDPYNSDEYAGTMTNHPTDNYKVIFIFTDKYIQDEDELIVNSDLIIDDDILVDSDFAGLLGFTQGFTIQHGSYEIINDGSGYQEVIVDIDY